MEKEWPPVEESAVYRVGILPPYLEKKAWEDDEEYLDKSITDAETYADEDYFFTYQPRSIKIFLDQLRNSRGYDVSSGLPDTFRCPFLVFHRRYYLPPTISKPRDRAIRTAVEHISFKTKKPYCFVNLLNFNYTNAQIFFLTFTDKDTSLPDAADETFLAAVFGPLHEEYGGAFKVEECPLRPDHDAPTTPAADRTCCVEEKNKKDQTLASN